MELMELMEPQAQAQASAGSKEPAPDATTRFFLSAIDDVFGADDDEVSEGFTPAQEAKRRRWAMILCTGALNETSLKMAQRVCKSWFPNCQCECRRGSEN